MNLELQVEECSPGKFYCTLVAQRLPEDASRITFHFAQMLMSTRDAAAALGGAALRSQQARWAQPMAMTSDDPADVDTIPGELFGGAILRT